jgi:5'-nucleotidase
MRILVDMDGVLADFESAFLTDWQRQHPEKAFVPLDARTTFYLNEQYPQELREFVFSIYCAPKFFRQLAPIPGGAQALTEMQRLGYEVFICTSPLEIYENCVLEKFQWVDEHLGHSWIRQLVLTSDKTLVRADILIDDKPVISGVETPNWEHILYDQPYNRSDTTKRRLTWQNWKSVLGLD